MSHARRGFTDRLSAMPATASRTNARIAPMPGVLDTWSFTQRCQPSNVTSPSPFGSTNESPGDSCIRSRSPSWVSCVIPVLSRANTLDGTPLSAFGAPDHAVRNSCGFSASGNSDTGPEWPVSYTHLRAHETDSYLVCRLLLEKK